MFNSKGFLPVLITVLVVVILGAGAYWFYTQSQSTTGSATVATTSPTTSTTAIPANTSNTGAPVSTNPEPAPVTTAPATQPAQQTYANAQYGFNLSYPSGWSVVANQSTVGFDTGLTSGVNVATLQNTGTPYGNVTVSASKNAVDVANCSTAPQDEMDPVTGVTKVTLNGVSFFSYEDSQPAAGQLEVANYYKAVHDGTCYVLSTNFSGLETTHSTGTQAEQVQATQTAQEAQLNSIADSFTFSS